MTTMTTSTYMIAAALFATLAGCTEDLAPTEGDQIEGSLQVESRRRSRFEQRVAKFENKADAAEVMKRATCFGFGIHDRYAIRQRRQPGVQLF